MAPTPTPTLGPSGIDQLSPAQLLRTARLFAADPALPSLMDSDEEEARWVELDSRPELQIWLLSWPAGTHNDWHDHGESVGAFQVVSGTLLEQTSRKHRREFRTLIAGEGRSFEQNHLHHLANVRAAPPGPCTSTPLVSPPRRDTRSPRQGCRQWHQARLNWTGDHAFGAGSATDPRSFADSCWREWAGRPI
jgi:hypothetical protein